MKHFLRLRFPLKVMLRISLNSSAPQPDASYAQFFFVYTAQSYVRARLCCFFHRRARRAHALLEPSTFAGKIFFSNRPSSQLTSVQSFLIHTTWRTSFSLGAHPQTSQQKEREKSFQHQKIRKSPKEWFTRAQWRIKDKSSALSFPPALVFISVVAALLEKFWVHLEDFFLSLREWKTEKSFFFFERF